MRNWRCDVAERSAQVTWQGDLMSGNGEIHEVPSGAFGPLQVTWASRAEDDHGGRTSPEELIAAAHASCFAMALSNGLARGGNAPERLETSATITFVPGTGITNAALTVVGRVPGIDEAAFQQAAEAAKDGCPVSGALKGNVELTLDARLVQE
jgi:osmotically inducible protein OsmC